jgi:P-type Cu+ transporter
MPDQRPIPPTEDPVCGMTVDPETARAKGLALAHEGHEYVFCGKGCLLEFRDAPEVYLAEGYSPSM